MAALRIRSAAIWRRLALTTAVPTRRCVVLGAAIGYLASPRMAVELEYAYRRSYATVTGHATERDSAPMADGMDFDERVTVRSGMRERPLPLRRDRPQAG